MVAFLIVLIVLQGLGILFKLYYLIASIADEGSNELTAYCLFSVAFSILFEVGFAICLGVLAWV